MSAKDVIGFWNRNGWNSSITVEEKSVCVELEGVKASRTIVSSLDVEPALQVCINELIGTAKINPDKRKFLNREMFNG